MSISPKLSSRIGGLVFWLIFLFSGLAALIYQVCWQRLLGVYYGVGSVSVAIIVSIFMLGLGFGGLAGAFVSRRTKHVVFVYIVIEFLVAAFGLSSLHLLEEIGVRTAGSSYVYMLLFVSLFLIVPTVLMGATLPIAIAISEQRRRDLLGNVSFYYFVNTVGAAFGALLASYVMISIFNIDVAVKVAVAINLILAAAMYYVSLSPHESASVPVEPSTQIVKGVRRGNLLSVAALLFLNGFIAIGYQIIWFRIVAILLKDSIYTFSTMLFVYLLGIAVGSLALSYYSSRAERLPQFDLYLSLNIAIAVVSLVSLGLLYATIDIPPLGWIAESTHRYDVLPHLGDMGKWDGQLTLVYTLAVVVLWPLLLVLLPTIFMGAAFPVGLSLFADRADGSGSTVGVAYALTIAGNALGGLVTAFALLPNLGTTLVLAAFLTLQLSYVFLLGSTFAGRGLKFLSASAVVAVLIFTPDAANFYKKLHRDYPGFGMYFNEGVEGTVVSFEKDDQLRMFINGSNHGGDRGRVLCTRR
ncbi:MAG: hypothetical protein A49_05710 [Methyloceanibacter sp.]|nr:MAG: hypothetical protein A49_05710 [Methyloceanibacter sp.]